MLLIALGTLVACSNDGSPDGPVETVTVTADSKAGEPTTRPAETEEGGDEGLEEAKATVEATLAALVAGDCDRYVSLNYGNADRDGTEAGIREFCESAEISDYEVTGATASKENPGRSDRALDLDPNAVDVDFLLGRGGDAMEEEVIAVIADDDGSLKVYDY